MITTKADPCLVLWQAMNEAGKVGNRTDDKLIVKFLREAGYGIAHIVAKDTEQAQEPQWQAPGVSGAQQAAGQEPYTSERHFALREANCIGDGEKFWKARPGTKDDGRAIAFDAGYVRGFDRGTELADARAALAQRREPTADEMARALEVWFQCEGSFEVRMRSAFAAIGATTGEQHG